MNVHKNAQGCPASQVPPCEPVLSGPECRATRGNTGVSASMRSISKGGPYPADHSSSTPHFRHVQHTTTLSSCGTIRSCSLRLRSFFECHPYTRSESSDEVHDF